MGMLMQRKRVTFDESAVRYRLAEIYFMESVRAMCYTDTFNQDALEQLARDAIVSAYSEGARLTISPSQIDALVEKMARS